MDLTQYVLLGAVLVGVNQLIRHARASDWWGVVTIAGAVVVGAIFGVFGVEGLDLVHGIALAFGSVGSLTAIAQLGSNNTVAPSDPIAKG